MAALPGQRIALQAVNVLKETISWYDMASTMKYSFLELYRFVEKGPFQWYSRRLVKISMKINISVDIT